MKVSLWLLLAIVVGCGGGPTTPDPTKPTVTIAIVGMGSVVSGPGPGISCTSPNAGVCAIDCNPAAPASACGPAGSTGVTYMFSAVPATGWHLVSWASSSMAVVTTSEATTLVPGAYTVTFAQDTSTNTIHIDGTITLTGAEATLITGNVLTLGHATDSDPNATLMVVMTSSFANAQTATIAADGTLMYTGNTPFHGTDACTIQVMDGTGSISNAANVQVVVTQDVPPTCTDSQLDITEGQVAALDDLAANCVSPGLYPMTLDQVSASLHGLVVHMGTLVSYTPAPNFVGDDIVTYTVTDGHGGTGSGMVTIHVHARPVAGNYTYTTHINVPFSANVLTDTTGNPSTSGDPVLVVSQVFTAVSSAGMATVLPDGRLNVTPAHNAYGTITLSYTVTDGRGAISASGTVTINVIDDAPVARDLSFTTQEDTPTKFLIFPDPATVDDDGPLSLSISIIAGALHGSTTPIVDATGGAVRYIPVNGFAGTDTFTYVIVDGAGVVSNTATVTITVTPTRVATPTLMLNFSFGGWLPYLFAHPPPPGHFQAFVTTGLVAGTANLINPGINAGIKTCLTTADGNFCYVGAAALVPYQVTTGPLLTQNTPNTLIANIVGVEPAMASVHTATGDFVYALARIKQPSGPDVFNLFQFKVVTGSLVALSPPSIVVAPAGNSIAIDPTGKFLYVSGYTTATGASGQSLTVSGPLISQLAIAADGTLSPLSPATFALADVNALTGHLAISPDGASLYDPAFDGASSFIAQLTRNADGTLVAQTPATVATAVNPFELALTGSFAYAVDIAGSILELSVNATGGLTPVTTFPLGSSCTHANNLSYNRVDQLLLVPCPQPGNLQALAINADGSLTPASWSPFTVSGQIPANTLYWEPLL